jgi:hypothetical protein
MSTLLIASRSQRFPPSCPRYPMPSTVIRSFHYDASKRELLVVFQSGREYIYQDVPAETFEGMKSSFAKGEYFNAHIRGKFSFVRRVPA